MLDPAERERERRAKQRRALQRKTPFKLRPHHARPIRKRHVLGLSIFVFWAAVSLTAGLSYVYGQFNKQLNATLSATNQAGASRVTAKATRIQSTLGFSMIFDPRVVDVHATVQPGAGQATSYDSYNVGVPRAYTGVTVGILNDNGQPIAGSSLTVSVLQDRTVDANDETTQRALAAQFSKPATGDYRASAGVESNATINGVSYFKQTYTYTPLIASRGQLVFGPITSDIYVTALANGMPVIIKVNYPSDQKTYQAVYEAVLQTFSIDSDQLQLGSASTPIVEGALRTPKLLAVAERLGIVTQTAAAASLKLLDESQIIATNAPAVVKIYHVVCGVIVYQGEQLTADSCAGTSGTGFFVSADGYIVTNGHVVTSDPKAVLINNMSPSLLTKMLQIDGYTSSEIMRIVSQLGTGGSVDAMVSQAIGKLPDAALFYQDKKDFYIVATSNDVPKIDQIPKQHTFKETTTIKLAELKGIDYNTADLYSSKGFTHSDVALLKLSGENHPVVQLGSIDGLVQGAGITVIGFPGDAESSLVKNDTLQSTSTQGIVSAIREVNGGSLKVIQSDVNIGHGNSGGPALDQYGRVVGVATYLIGGSQSGDAGISYLRDINDARNLIKAESVKLETTSKTQTLWEQGLDAFYSAHYKAAIKDFEQVKSLYPSHVLADHYITMARTNIANGEEAQSIWVPITIVVSLVVSLGGIVFVSILMVRHRAHHHLYQAIQAGYIHGPFAAMQPAHAATKKAH